MADSRKRIVLTAEDSGVSNTMEKIARKIQNAFGVVNKEIEELNENMEKLAVETSGKMSEMEANTSTLFKELVKDSTAYGKTINERLKYLDKELKTLEKINQEEIRRGKEEAKRKYDERMDRAPKNTKEGREARKSATDEYQDRLMQLDQEEALNKQQDRALRDKFRTHAEDVADLEKKKENDKRAGSSDDDDEKSSGNTIINRTVNTGRGIGNSALTALGFGAILSIGGFIGKIISEAMEQEAASGRKRGIGGTSSASSFLDLKAADFLEYQRNFQLSGGKDAGANAKYQLAFERGYGLENGQLNPLNTALRSVEGRKVDSAEKLAQEQLSIFKKSKLWDIDKGDFSLLGEKLDFANSMNQQQSMQREFVDATFSNQLLAAFGKVGGSFADQRQADTIQTINSSITDPGNDFKKAYLYRTIKGQMPGASLFDVMKRQQEGIYGQGTFAALMQNLTNDFSGEQLYFNVSKMTGLNLAASERLSNAFSATPDMFNNVTGQSDIDAILAGGRQDSMGRAGANTGTVQQWNAEFNTWAAGKGQTAIDKISEYKDAYEKGGFAGLATAIGNDIVDAIKAGFDGLKNLIDGFLNPTPEDQVKTLTSVTAQGAANIQSLQDALKKDPGNLDLEMALDAAETQQELDMAALERAKDEADPTRVQKREEARLQMEADKRYADSVEAHKYDAEEARAAEIQAGIDANNAAVMNGYTAADGSPLPYPTESETDYQARLLEYQKKIANNTNTSNPTNVVKVPKK